MDTKNNILDNKSPQLPAGWLVKRLGDHCIKIASGSTPTGGSEAYQKSGISLIRSQNIHDFTFSYNGLAFINEQQANKLKNVEVQQNDVLLNITGDSVARCCSVPYNILPARVNQHVMIIRPDERIFNAKFLQYYLLNRATKEYLLSIAASGATRNALTKGHIENLDIIAPSIEEQKEIAAILSSLDDKIELNQQINKKLEEVARAIFKEWFIDFNFPDENGNPYRNSGGAMIDSELGLIPASWSVKKLDEIAEFTNGLAMQKFRPCEHEKSLPVLKIKELRQGSTDINSDRCTVNIPDNVKVFDGDIIFSWSGSLMVDLWTDGCAGLNQHLFKVTSDKYSKAFYYLWTKYHLAEFIAIAQDKMTTMGHIQRKHLSDAKVFCPDDIILQKFNDTVNPMIEQIISNRVEAVKLANSRDTLLPKLISGELIL